MILSSGFSCFDVENIALLTKFLLASRSTNFKLRSKTRLVKWWRWCPNCRCTRRTRWSYSRKWRVVNRLWSRATSGWSGGRPPAWRRRGSGIGWSGRSCEGRKSCSTSHRYSDKPDNVHIHVQKYQMNMTFATYYQIVIVCYLYK